MRPVRLVIAVAVVAGAAGVGGCSGPSGAIPSTGCAPIHEDPIDIRSTLHLLPGAPEPPYLTNPPTSGAHRVGYYPRGMLTTPLSRPIQVALLEKGFVMVQYQPGVAGAPAALAPLLALSPYVTIAPNPTLPNPVVATAWLFDRRCGDAGPKSVAGLEQFVRRRVGRGSEAVIPLSETTPGGSTTTTSTGP
jgi:hypothetical protein